MKKFLNHLKQLQEHKKLTKTQIYVSTFCILLFLSLALTLPNYLLKQQQIFKSQAAGGTTYYVATNGSNTNPGTITQPFATIQKAHDVAVAGDTIYVRGGTYTLTNQIILNRSGSSGSRINLWAYPAETPVIDGINLGSSSTNGIYMPGASWWHIKGLEVKNAYAHGIGFYDGAHDNIIENNNIHHNVRVQTSGAGILLSGNAGGNNLILNNDSHHNSINQVSGTGGDGIGVGTQSSGNVLRGNRVWRNHDDGVDLSWSLAVLVEDNWAWENGFDDNLQKTSGNGTGFKLALTPPPSNGGHTVRRNLAWNNGEDGFHVNMGSIGDTVYNNTAWGNNRPGMYNFNFSNGTGVDTLRNNLSGNPNTASIQAADIHDHNSWDSSPAVTVTSADFLTTDFTANTGARQADGSLPTSNFLKLISGSDLIDKGINVGLPYSGTAPDLGAYEFTTTPTPTPTPTSTQTPSPSPTPGCGATYTSLNVSSAASDTGFAYIVAGSFGTPADNGSFPARSTLRLFENGVEIGPAHAAHVDIRNLGAGRFSHWASTDGTDESIRFAASDNTDPRTNGRTYTYTTGCNPTPACTQQPLNASSAVSNTGFAYNLGYAFGTTPDSTANPTISTLRLFENNLELGPAHSAHVDIRNLGQGRFSHWSSGTGEESLYFSASDNTDPRTNGKTYTYCIGTTPPVSTPTFTPIPTVTPTPTPTNTPTPTPPSGDTIKPTVTITSPANGSRVRRRTNVTVQATALDNVMVTRVEFRRNSALICTDSTAPYSCSMYTDNGNNITVTYEARAYDAANNTASHSVSVVTQK
jgi:hypothetical protein